jgi:hypothetical protein
MKRVDWPERLALLIGQKKAYIRIFKPVPSIDVLYKRRITQAEKILGGGNKLECKKEYFNLRDLK